MAITKDFDKSSLSIEVEAGTTTSGSTIYRKKSFSGLTQEATPENIFAVAEAIRGILKNPTRYYFINDVSLLNNSEM